MEKIKALLFAVSIMSVLTFAMGSTETERLKELSNALGKQVEVVSAAPAASIQRTDNGVSVGTGAALTFRIQFNYSGKATFEIAGSGKPSVACDKAEVASTNGSYSFKGKKGTTYDVTVSAADAAITVSNVKVKKGMLIRVD